MKKSFLLLLLLTLAVSEASAQTSYYNLSGTLREAGSGEALIGFNVVIYADSLRKTDPLYVAVSNKFGFYAIPRIRSGALFLFASGVGYETFKLMLEPAGKSETDRRIDIELHKQAIQLGDVVVEGKKITDFTSTTSTIEIDPNLIKQLPSFGGETDIFRALQLLPGVTAATELSTGIYVRGGSQDQNLTLVDGVTVYNPSHLGGFSSTFNSDAIQNLRLIKGAFPAEYGGRLSSVLDLTMKEGTREKFVGRANINTISSRITVEGPLSPNLTYFLSGRLMYLDKILPAVPKADAFPKYHFSDFNGKLNYVISDKDRVFISGFYSSDVLTEPERSKDIGFDIQWQNATTNITWTRIHSSTFFTNTALMYTRYKFSTLMRDKNPSVNSVDFFTSSTVNDVSLRTELQYYPSSEHYIKGGGELVYHIFNTVTSDRYEKELLYRSNFGDDLGILEGAVYVQDDWTVSEDVQINAGVRGHFYPETSFFGIEPRLSVTYKPLDLLALRAAFAVSHQPLHLLGRNDIYLPTDVWYPSTSTIKPARSVQASFGVEATSYDRTFLFSVEGYVKDMQHLYEYRDNASFTYGTEFTELMTEGRGEAYGVELFLNKRIGDITGWVGYTVSWTRRYFDLLNRGEGYYPRYDRRHDISIVITYDVTSDLNVGATWTYATGQAFPLPIMQYGFIPFTTPKPGATQVFYEYSGRDAYRLPAFHKLDLSAQYRFDWGGSEVEVSFNVYNAYNRYNAFSKYIGYKTDPKTGDKVPILKQFTLFPILPSLGISFKF